MVPTVTQQLRSMRRRFCDTILPALPADADFAREQANLMLATFDWLLDTHEHEYRYQVVENHEYRALLAALSALTGGDRSQVDTCLAEPGPARDEASVPLADLAGQNRRLKEHAMSLASALLDGPGPSAARTLLANAARAQGDRELAYYRSTGFPQNAAPLGSNLDSARHD
ncbi:hypothetical protein [Saccharopolyspora sp. NPDC002578]